ncbi:MAG: DUF2304 domain-containing protein [Nitrospirota bacterium]
MDKVQVVSLVVSFCILIGVIDLVRRGKLKENYSVLWICTSLIIMFFAIFRHLIDWLGRLVGIYYSPSAFFLMAFIFIMLITLQFSVVISKLSERNKVLAQEIALLRLKVEELERMSAS